jgi:signal transduction histidine kinase
VEERTLILAPRGRDAQVIEQLLTGHKLASFVCENSKGLIVALAEGAASAVIAEEAIDPDALGLLGQWLVAQPVWSDFPFVVLASKRSVKASASLKELVRALGNVVVVERPVSGDTLASTAHSALRARRRQYDARALLAERETAAEDLRQADRRKDQFLAMLAHELRNPLAPIRSAAEVLRHDESDSPPRVRWARQLIERQAQQLSSLLEDLLDVSRITTGKVTLQVTELELNVLLSKVIDSMRSEIEARHHTLTVSLTKVPIFVHGDPVRLTQVFGNLLDNAAKYTPAGGRIEVSSELTSHAAGQRAIVRVADNGVGVAHEDMSHIFELFVQSDRALGRAQGGLGIGLSLVRSILEMHGGTIQAQSQGLGRGTCFSACLPVHIATVEPTELCIPPRGEPAHALDILIIDDNEDAAKALAVLLEMDGHSVRTAADGPTGLNAAETKIPDVVLLDIGLPGMDGYEVAEQLRQRSDGSLKLIAVTGYGQPEDVRRAMQAGFDHHLVKPVQIDKISAIFEKVGL